MVQRGLLLAAMLMACLSLGRSSFGADADVRALMERVSRLEAKNASLERQVATSHAGRTVTAEVDRAIAKSDATMGSVVTGADPHCRPLKVGGYFDTSYEFNFNMPDNQNNNQRIFDRDSNGFNVHLAELTFDRLPTKAGEAGFRVDLAYGTDANKFSSLDNSSVIVNGVPTGLPADRIVDLKQAYISYVAGLGCENGVTLDMGKFVTWSGAEVIEASDNINASRSLLFGVIPFTHTGLRATYPIWSGDKCGHAWTIGAGIVNGWDNIQDQNDSKTAIFMSNLQVTKWFNWVITGTAGNEGFVDESTRLDLVRQTAAGNISFDPTTPGTFFVDNAAIPGIGAAAEGARFDAGDSGDLRFLIDSTATFTPWDKWTFAINGDYKNDEPGSLWGVAGYFKYQINKNWYIANRTEYLDDKGGINTGRKQAIWESTITLDWALSDPLHMRFEYRHDDSNVHVFSDTKGVGDGGVNINHPFRSDHQDTFMVQWLYKF